QRLGGAEHEDDDEQRDQVAAVASLDRAVDDRLDDQRDERARRDTDESGEEHDQDPSRPRRRVGPQPPQRGDSGAEAARLGGMIRIRDLMLIPRYGHTLDRT